MANEQNPILAMIDTLVEKKTFSLDVLDEIKNLRNTAERVGRENEELRTRLRETQANNTILQQRVGTLESAANSVADREKKVAALELQIAVDKKELELTKSFKSELSGLMLAAFKSPIVKSEMFGSMPVTSSGNPYPTSHPFSSTTTHAAE